MWKQVKLVHELWHRFFKSVFVQNICKCNVSFQCHVCTF